MKTKRKFCSLTNTVTKMPTVLVFTKVKHFISIVAKYNCDNVFSISAELISNLRVNCIRLAQFLCSHLIGFLGSFLRKYRKTLAENGP